MSLESVLFMAPCSIVIQEVYMALLNLFLIVIHLICNLLHMSLVFVRLAVAYSSVVKFFRNIMFVVNAFDTPVVKKLERWVIRKDIDL